MTEPNIPLLRKAVEWVEEEATKPWWRSTWNQHDWVAPRRFNPERIEEDPWTFISPLDMEAWGISEEEAKQELRQCGTAYCVAGYIGQLLDPKFAHQSIASINGAPMHVSDYAALHLGIDSEQQCALFDAGNDATTVREIAEQIAGERL